MRARAIGLALLAILVGCDGASTKDPGRARDDTGVPDRLDGAPPSTSIAPDPVAEAFERFTAFPRLHATVLLHTSDGDDWSFELWAREPEFRVDARLGDSVVPWIVNEEGSNIREPHIHAPLLIQIDPRNLFMSCSGHEVIGSDSVIGRPVTGVRCRSGSEPLEFWLDDETGLVLRGSGEGSRWEFTSLTLDPEFPADVFEFEGEPEAA